MAKLAEFLLVKKFPIMMVWYVEVIGWVARFIASTYRIAGNFGEIFN